MLEGGLPSPAFGAAAVAADVANIDIAINTAPIEILCFMVISRAFASTTDGRLSEIAISLCDVHHKEVGDSAARHEVPARTTRRFTPSRWMKLRYANV
jgi:hypothetical protein